jgi:ribosomal protein L4
VNLYKSGRNIPKTEIRPVGELCAYEVLRRRKLVFTKSAFEKLLADPVTLGVAGTSQE